MAQTLLVGVEVRGLAGILNFASGGRGLAGIILMIIEMPQKYYLHQPMPENIG